MSTSDEIEIYCDGGTDNLGRSRHDPVTLGKISRSEAENDLMAWSFSGDHIRRADLRGEHTALSMRVKVACECGVSVVFGDRLGFGFTPPPPEGTAVAAASQLMRVIDSGAEIEPSATESRRRTNFAALDKLAANGVLRLSVLNLDRMLT